MYKKYKLKGNIDFIKDGFRHGWAVVTQDITTQNACDLWIDGLMGNLSLRLKLSYIKKI